VYKRDKKTIDDGQTRIQPEREMFTYLLFCSCFLAFFTDGTVSSSPVDYTPVTSALLNGNLELSTSASKYQRRLSHQQGKKHVS
jgi:hypothetical protein